MVNLHFNETAQPFGCEDVASICIKNRRHMDFPEASYGFP